MNTRSQNKAPRTLKTRWYMAARFAFLLVPMDEIKVGTQAPMFIPIIIGIAAAYVTMPEREND